MRLTLWRGRPWVLTGAIAILAACAPPEEGQEESPQEGHDDNGEASQGDGNQEAGAVTEQQSSLVSTIAWTPPLCFAGSFSGCNLTSQPRCTDAGGPYYANWDPSLKSVCQTACALPNPSSYCSWLPAQCSGTTFAGCSRVGQPVCSDWGGPSFPNWNDAAWAACQAACSSSNKNAYCAWQPAKVVAGTFSGCARTGQLVCGDWGGPSFPNWSDAAWAACQTACTSTCPNADPSDNVADDAALQQCLDAGGTIRLRPGSPGYILASGLVITQSNITLTSAAAPGRVPIVAAPTLAKTMLLANTPLSNLHISYITFDGNRPARSSLVSTCGGFRANQTNVFTISIDGGSFDHNRSTRTLCGSAYQFGGSNYEIAFNLFDDNGHGQEAVDAPEPWSDGITAGECVNTSLHDNWLTDDTDVAVVDGGGPGCLIQNNYVLQLNRHAFAGIQLGSFVTTGAVADHTGSRVAGNRVIGNGLMSFGIGLGHHPWDTSRNTKGGTIQNNTVSGAIVNLMVDGASNATIGANTLGPAFGSTPLCGGAATPYSVWRAHATNSTLAPGYVARSYDACIP